MRGLIAFLPLVALAACAPSARTNRLSEGKTLIANHCVACHEVPGVSGANGRVGPSLAGIARQQILAGHFANTPANMAAWIEHPQRLLPGNAMPEMGLSAGQTQVIVTYLYTLEDR